MGDHLTHDQRAHADTHGAERGLSRFEGFSDAVFAIALTLLIVEIKVPGSPEGRHGYSDLVSAMAEQWREFLALEIVLHGESTAVTYRLDAVQLEEVSTL